MNVKLVLLILGFVLGLFTASFIYLYSNFQQKKLNNIETTTPVSQPESNTNTSVNSLMNQYSDIQFLNLMIINHQDALQMAQRAVVSSTNDFIRNLSNTIISNQPNQINDIKIEIDKVINQNR